MSELVEIKTQSTTLHIRASSVDAVLDAMDQRGTPMPGVCVAIVAGNPLPLQLTKESLIEKLKAKAVLHG